MPTINTQTWIILAGIVVLALAAFAAWFLDRRKQSHQLRQRFDPEYDWPANELASGASAESEFKARENRGEPLELTLLAPSDVASFRYSWQLLQDGFSENPKRVVMQAEQLVRELMLKRGYPMGDFERRAADISVNYPSVVDNYRAAHAIAARNERGQADTDELRTAVAHYRALFDELLKPNEDTQEIMQARRIEIAAKSNV